jgi:hypothetical protein
MGRSLRASLEKVNGQMMKPLLIVSAAIEVGAGLGLLVSPSTIVWLLLGSSLESPAGLALGRVAGAALLSLGVACWFTHRQGSSATGLIAAMLLYNTAVGTILAIAGGANDLAGIVLWPAVGVHAVMAVWCITCLWNERMNVTSQHRA